MFFTFTGSRRDVRRCRHRARHHRARAPRRALRGDGRRARGTPRRCPPPPPRRRRHPRPRHVPRHRAAHRAAARSAAAVVAECLARDMWIYPAGSGVPPVTDAVMIGAPLTISEGEIDELVETPRRRHRRRHRARLRHLPRVGPAPRVQDAHRARRSRRVLGLRPPAHRGGGTQPGPPGTSVGRLCVDRRRGDGRGSARPGGQRSRSTPAGSSYGGGSGARRSCPGVTSIGSRSCRTERAGPG